MTDCNATALLPAVHVGVASLLMLFALQTELLQLCDSFWEDGELSIEEVYNLAKWLNENREACFEWPGNALVKPLQEIWADGEVDLEELRRMAWLLRDIQTTWVRRQIPKQRVYQLKPFKAGPARARCSPSVAGFSMRGYFPFRSRYLLPDQPDQSEMHMS